MYDGDDLLYYIFLVLAVIAFVVWAASASCEESNRREEIRRHCTQIRHISGDVVFMVGSRSDSIGFTPDKTCYRCPDGFEECF